MRGLEEAVHLTCIVDKRRGHTGLHPTANVTCDAIAEHRRHTQLADAAKRSRELIAAAGLHELEFNVGGCAELRRALDVIQGVDGLVLVPLLFSEAVNLHPVAIILAVLVFGSWWGLWGVFFAIPLVTLIKAIMTAWPSNRVAIE